MIRVCIDAMKYECMHVHIGSDILICTYTQSDSVMI